MLANRKAAHRTATHERLTERLPVGGGGARDSIGRPGVNDLDTKYLRDISRTLRFSAVGLLLIVVLWGLRDVLLLGFAAALIACLLRGAGNALHRHTGLGDGLSVAAVVLAVALGLGALLYWRAP